MGILLCNHVSAKSAVTLLCKASELEIISTPRNSFDHGVVTWSLDLEAVPPTKEYQLLPVTNQGRTKVTFLKITEPVFRCTPYFSNSNPSKRTIFPIKEILSPDQQSRSP